MRTKLRQATNPRHLTSDRVLENRYTTLIYIKDILQDRNAYFFDDSYLLDGGV